MTSTIDRAELAYQPFEHIARLGQDRGSQTTRPKSLLGHTTITGRSANSDALLVRASPK